MRGGPGARIAVAGAAGLVLGAGAARAEDPPPAGQVTALAVPGRSAAAFVAPAFPSPTPGAPPAAPDPRPLVVVLHGNYDRPEWECETWAGIVQGAAWVLCTRGVRRPGTTRAEDRWTYPDLETARAEMNEAAAVLRARYPARIAEGVYVLAGLSLGAFLARAMAVDQPARFARVVLIEGGGGGWGEPAVRRFFLSGPGARAVDPAHRIVFACGQRGCNEEARAAERRMARVGGAVRVVYDPEAGHNYSDRILGELRSLYLWLTAPAAAPVARTP